MTYSEKLKHPKWQKKRLQILKRGGFICQECGDENTTLHIHHKYYLGYNINPWDYPNDALCVLCENCHKQEQENCKIEIEKLILQLKKSGYMAQSFFSLRKHLQDGGKIYYK